MNRNLVGSIYERFSIRIANFVPIINKHCCHRQLLFLIGQFKKISCLFCTIALQSIKLELPPCFILCDCIAIYEIGVTSLFYFARLHCNLLNWSYLPFYFARLHCNLLNWSYLPFYFA